MADTTARRADPEPRTALSVLEAALVHLDTWTAPQLHDALEDTKKRLERLGRDQLAMHAERADLVATIARLKGDQS